MYGVGFKALRHCGVALLLASHGQAALAQNCHSTTEVSVRLYKSTSVINTSISEECVSGSPCTEPTNWPKEVVYSVTIPASEPLVAGEILVVLAELQAEYDTSCCVPVGPNRHFATQIGIGSDSSVVDFPAIEEITDNQSSNLVNDGQGLVASKMIITRVGTFQVGTSFGAGLDTINLVAWANGGPVSIEANNGHLSVVRITPRTGESGTSWAMTHHSSDDLLVSSLPSGNVKSPAYSVPLPATVGAGDIIVALSELYGEFDGTGSSNFASELWMTDDVNATGSTYGVKLSPANALQLNSATRSRATLIKAAAYQVPDTLTAPQYVVHRAWSNNGVDELFDGSGRLSVLHMRAIGIASSVPPVAVTRLGGEYGQELACTIPPASVKTVVYSEPACRLIAGETLVALAEVEVTNHDGDESSPSPKRLASEVILADSPSGLTPSCTSCVLTENNSQIVHREVHHGVSTKVGALTLGSSYSSQKYIQHLLWSPQGFDGSCPGSLPNCCEGGECDQSSCDIIEPHRGRLSVLRITPLR